MKDLIGNICEVFQELSDLIWGFPTNLTWYKSLPIIGEVPFVIILLVGTGIYFSLRLSFVQVRYFRYGLKRLKENSGNSKNGISPLASLLLSTAMRVGPGNILGVTGAVSTGGPGALFWMWLSAFFGMATAFLESTLSQIYKERQQNDYVGGMPYYGRKLLGNSVAVGAVLGFLYIVYAVLCIPAQGFNTISSMVSICHTVTGINPETNTAVIWLFFLIVMGLVTFAVFGGLKSISRIINVLVPVMAVIYAMSVLFMVVLNIDKLPWFFYVVLTEAFKPESIFGGGLGVALSQGIKRGLMSNEAGQGTLTMAAAVSDADHPCEQGAIQSIGVFLDTMVICTLTGFVVVMGKMWLGEGATAWLELGFLQRFLASCAAMIGDGTGTTVVVVAVSVCFGIFAFTSLLGFISFSEICVRRIGSGNAFVISTRCLNLAVLAFGMATGIAGFDLSALWNLSDLANIIMVCINLPLLFIGFSKVKKAVGHFELKKEVFNSDAFGENLPVWDEKAKHSLTKIFL